MRLGEKTLLWLSSRELLSLGLGKAALGGRCLTLVGERLSDSNWWPTTRPSHGHTC